MKKLIFNSSLFLALTTLNINATITDESMCLKYDVGDACFHIANKYIKQKDYKKAFPWLKKAAEKGEELLSMYLLGLMYANGEGVQVDYNKAIYWLKQAANNKNSFTDDSQYMLGIVYLRKMDSQKGWYWIKKAAENGNKNAKETLKLLLKK